MMDYGDLIDEQERILRAYQARGLRVKESFFGYENLAHVYRIQERYAETLRLLAEVGYESLSGLHILDVGCGDGSMLRQFMQWGATPDNLAGIDLRSEPIDYARQRSPTLDLRCGSATELPWPDAFFQLVCQNTVFTSILEPTMKQQIAQEMTRVLCRGGAIIWYDFMYDNPRNPDVRGVTSKEIHDLFPSLEMHLHRITLAAPLARHLPSAGMPMLYPWLAAIPLLRTHYLGLLIKR